MEKHLQLPQESVKGWKLCWFSKASYDLCAEDQPRLSKWKPKNIKPWPVFTCHSERDLVWCLRCNRKSTNSSLADLPYTSRDIPNKILIPAMKWAKKNGRNNYRRPVIVTWQKELVQQDRDKIAKTWQIQANFSRKRSQFRVHTNARLKYKIYHCSSSFQIISSLCSGASKSTHLEDIGLSTYKYVC